MVWDYHLATEFHNLKNTKLLFPPPLSDSLLLLNMDCRAGWPALQPAEWGNVNVPALWNGSFIQPKKSLSICILSFHLNLTCHWYTGFHNTTQQQFLKSEIQECHSDLYNSEKDYKTAFQHITPQKTPQIAPFVSKIIKKRNSSREQLRKIKTHTDIYLKRALLKSVSLFMKWLKKMRNEVWLSTLRA